MKKILLIGGLAISSMAVSQSAFNKISIDGGVGISKIMEPVRPGYETGFGAHVNLGVRYMPNNKFGLKIDFDYDQIKSKKEVPEIREFKTNMISQHFLAVVNWGNVLNAYEWTKNISVVGFGGPGFTAMFGNDRTDVMLNLKGGAMIMYKISPKVAIYGNASASIYAMNDWYVDMDYRRGVFNSKGHNQVSGFDGYQGSLALGASFYLGEAAEHADWTPNQNGNPEELEALKTRLAKAEKDMMDDDKDGVPNYIDQEPATAEGAIVDMKGVAVKVEKVVDIDGDGVLDVDDFCPTIKGTAAANGCPDKDGDGVYDFIDKCPTLPGTAESNGCPVVKETDKATLSKAMKGVQFVSGKATILKKSHAILDKVAEVMVTNPSYNLEINGHTDNVGDPANNLTLSNERAASVKVYLLGKGVSADRMTSTGYGDSKPKDTNTTAKGRAENRRVEFVVNFKEK